MPDYLLDSHFTLVLALIVAAFGVARVTRLGTQDSFPPIEWLRIRWINLVGESYGKLAICPWCQGVWVAAACVAHGYISGVNWTWWALWGVAALAQIGSTIVMYDEPPAE